MAKLLLEVCVDDATGLAAAIEGGADRIELCSALSVGGLTPSAGLMALAARAPVPVYAMIRPRAGDFVYSDAELDIMVRDIDAARHAGLVGVVFGASKKDGSLDAGAMKRLIGHAAGLGMTLHRAFDLVPDPVESLEAAIDLGFERILTSGGAVTAAEGVDVLEKVIAAANGRISIMPGAGVNVQAVDALLPRLPVSEIHASCSVSKASSNQTLVALGFSPAQRRRTDAATVRAVKARALSLVA